MLGAGDAFMGGFLRGWLRDEPLEQACAYANACGAFAVSRLLCSPEYPTWEELQHFLRHGAATPRLRLDPALGHIHWATTRRPAPATSRRLPSTTAGSSRRWRTGSARRGRGFRGSSGSPCGRWRKSPRRPPVRASRLGLPASHLSMRGVVLQRASSHLLMLRCDPGLRPGEPRSTHRRFGLLLDGTYGREALFEAAEHGFWIGRPVEKPGSRPLAFETPDLGSHLAEWPLAHTVKCLCFYHPGDPPELKERQEAALVAVQDACRTTGRELLIEIIASKHGEVADDDRRRRAGAALCRRAQARLVEARAADERRRLARDRGRDPGRRSVLPRRRAPRPRGAGGRARRGLPRLRRKARP